MCVMVWWWMVVHFTTTSSVTGISWRCHTRHAKSTRWHYLYIRRHSRFCHEHTQFCSAVYALLHQHLSICLLVCPVYILDDVLDKWWLYSFCHTNRNYDTLPVGTPFNTWHCLDASPSAPLSDWLQIIREKMDEKEKEREENVIRRMTLSVSKGPIDVYIYLMFLPSLSPHCHKMFASNGKWQTANGRKEEKCKKKNNTRIVEFLIMVSVYVEKLMSEEFV